MSNRLAKQPSLYLRQHAEDPVDWYPWCEEALDLARETGKPIMLSIGYSACHWCHVMARESFSDPQVAALLSEHFVSIKVDREERPDLDRMYQLAHQVLQRRPGGWPLTAFVDARTLLPFYVGTYFPPSARSGMPAFPEVLVKVAAWYADRPEELARHNDAIGAFLRDYDLRQPEQGALTLGPLAEAERRWLAQADPVHGGHVGAPKFPPSGELRLCATSSRGAVQEHAATSLLGMARGGLQDHVGGGFFRYCVDERWEIPHFEKMLYDNALLLPEFARAAMGGSPEMRSAAIGIVQWLREEMALSTGGFAASLDADSDHREGAYYVWSKKAVAEALTSNGESWLLGYFGLEKPPNFEGEAWHLNARKPLSEWSEPGSDDYQRRRDALKLVTRRLRLIRAQRPAPARDGKCVLSWNALLLSGLARAAQSMARSDWTDLAAHLADDLLRRHCRQGAWYSVVYAEGVGARAFLDDHAALAVALLDMLEARWSTAWLDAACTQVDLLLEEFEDVERGGFYFVAKSDNELPQHSKPFTDDATPSGNGLAVQALLRLGWLIGEPRYLQAAERALRAGWEVLQDLPHGCASMLWGLRLHLTTPPVLIARIANSQEGERWREPIQQARMRGAHVVTLAAAEHLLPQALEDKRWLAGGRVYWCEGTRCLPRFDSPVALEAQLAKRQE